MAPFLTQRPRRNLADVVIQKCFRCARHAGLLSTRHLTLIIFGYLASLSLHAQTVKLEGKTTVIAGTLQEYRMSFWQGNFEVRPPINAAYYYFTFPISDPFFLSSPSGNVSMPEQVGKIEVEMVCDDFGRKYRASLDVDVVASPVLRPVIESSGGNLLPNGATFRLSTGDYESYKWFKGGKIISEESSITTLEAGRYIVEVTYAGNVYRSNAYTLSRPPAVVGNYILANSIQQPLSSLSGIESLTPDQNQKEIQFFDGLGRNSQSISISASPTGRDIIQPIEYDSFGRQAVTYLPYQAPNTGGFYRKSGIGLGSLGTGGYVGSDHHTFYTQNEKTVARSGKAYSERIFERSPLNRVLENGSPGETWQLGSGATVKTEYRSNNSYEVIYFNQDINTGNLQWRNGDLPIYYASNQLRGLIITDENGSEQITFTDKHGKTILKRVRIAVSGSQNQYADTYYIYDISDNLAYVLPPEAVKHLLESIPH